MTDKTCRTCRALLADAEAALRDMLRVQESLMPGVRHIVVQDYALLNEAPIAARAVLTRIRERTTPDAETL